MKGTRLPEDWMLPAEWRTWALAHIDKRLALDAFTANDYTSEIADNFADYWISKSSAATKLNWQRTWQVWVRREVQTNGWRIEKRTAEKAPATFTPKDTSAMDRDGYLASAAVRLGVWRPGMSGYEIEEAVRLASRTEH
tara:strand:- start:254 stop:670 length:417 start_codon:yes stop_codon:yes gene_type:complete